MVSGGSQGRTGTTLPVLFKTQIAVGLWLEADEWCFWGSSSNVTVCLLRKNTRIWLFIHRMLNHLTHPFPTGIGRVSHGNLVASIFLWDMLFWNFNSSSVLIYLLYFYCLNSSTFKRLTIRFLGCTLSFLIETDLRFLFTIVVIKGYNVLTLKEEELDPYLSFCLLYLSNQFSTSIVWPAMCLIQMIRLESTKNKT